MKKLFLLNFLFLIFVSLFFICIFLVSPFFQNYFSNSFIDIAILEPDEKFSFGKYSLGLPLIFGNLIVAFITTYILNKIGSFIKKEYLIVSIFLNLDLFLWINNDLANFIIFPFNQFSILNFLILLVLFFIFWFFLSKFRNSKHLN